MYVSSAEALGEDCFLVEGRAYRFQGFGKQTEAALYEEARKWYIHDRCKTIVTSDRTGDSDIFHNDRYVPLTHLVCLREDTKFCTPWGNILVEDGSLTGVILYTGKRWEVPSDNVIRSYISNYCHNPKGDCFSVFYTDGTVLGGTERNLHEYDSFSECYETHTYRLVKEGSFTDENALRAPLGIL